MTAETFSVLFTAWAMMVVAMAAPGPNLIASASTALGKGRRAGFATVAGIASGTLVWALLSSFGVAAVFKAFPAAFITLKVLGGAYLVWLGIRSLRAAWKGTPGAIRPDERPVSMRAAWARGAAVCLSNPKSALFWTSISVFVLSAHAAAMVVVEFCLLAGLTSFSVYGVYVLLFSSSFARSFYRRAMRWFEALFGAFFCLVGGQLILSR